MDVLLAQAVLVAVLDEALGGVDHEDALAGGGVLLVEHQDAGGDAGAVEEVGGQADDALEVAGADELPADDGLDVAPEEHAVGQDAGAFALAPHRADDVQQVGVVALLGGRLAPLEALEGVVGGREAGAPGLVGEGRIGDDVVVGAQLLAVLELGLARVLPERMLAVGKSCRIMFMRARPAVVTSFSCPSSVMCLPASAATFSSSEPEPQVGS